MDQGETPAEVQHAFGPVSQESSTKVLNWNLVKRLEKALPGVRGFAFSWLENSGVAEEWRQKT